MKVRLTKKLAERLDGVDVSGREEGEVLDLPLRDATMLVNERWAIPERRERIAPGQERGRRAEDSSLSASNEENRPRERPSRKW